MNSLELEGDIKNTVDDYLAHSDNISIEEICEYVIEILKNLYEKKNRLYWGFEPYIRQIISLYKPKIYGYYYNDFQIKDRSSTVAYLKTIPQYEQRTPEWFEQKTNTIGASESACLFDLNPYSKESELILRKCGWENTAKMNSSRMEEACEHGTKFEPIVQMLYCLREKTELFEFGSIVHEEHSIISASPDGITPKGIMVEIKVPLNRKITGIPPPYYWVQMQQQMQVCNLDLVHFIECRIEEYDSRESYKSDYIGEDKDVFLTSDNLEKGVLVVYININDSKKGYIYPDRLLKTSEIAEFVKNTKKILDKDDSKMFACEKYWKLVKYSKTVVWRDEEWWKKNVYKFMDVWKKIEHYKENGYESLIPKKKEYIKKDVTCMIESDTESIEIKPPKITSNNDTCLINSDED